MTKSTKTKAKHDALEEAIHKAGGVTALADKLGVTKAAVSQWRAIPMRHVERVHEAFGIAKRRLLEPHLGSTV